MKIPAKYRSIYTAAALIGLLFASACNKEDILLSRQTGTASLTVGGYIANNFDCTLLAAALDYTGLLDTLNNTVGAYTLLAPDDAAFGRVGITSVAQVRQLDRDSLRLALLSHILPQRLQQTAIPIQHNYAIRTLSGYYLRLSRATASTVIPSFSGAELRKETDLYDMSAISSISTFGYSSTNYEETELVNGYVQRIDRPIRPFFHQTVQQFLENHAEYSIFVAGLKKFDLWDELATATNLTVMAPTDATFNKWGFTLDALNAMDAADYIGGLLFGAYIVYDRQLLLSDFDYFYRTQTQYYYNDELRDAPGYYRFITGDGMSYYNYSTSGGISFTTGFLINRYYGFAYTLAINQANEPYARYRYNVEANAEFVLGVNDYPADFTGTVPVALRAAVLEQLPMGMQRFLSNNLCSNGIVHPFHALAVLPEEALRR